MRKIEREMPSALASNRPWAGGNTTVSPPDGSVYLHGNRIAYRPAPESPLTVDLETLAKWPTNTTRSRLRALGFRVKGDRMAND